jgi:hypothetical protein
MMVIDRMSGARRRPRSSAITPPSLIPATCAGARSSCSMRAATSSAHLLEGHEAVGIVGAAMAAMFDEHDPERLGEQWDQAGPPPTGSSIVPPPPCNNTKG